MVNLKKIGAIATGALFVGATLGTAAAVDFNSNMLVEAGAAKAKLVVGANAPGLAADTASAEVINDAVEAKFTTTTGGANIQFQYDEEDIDDTDSTVYPNGGTSGDDMEERDTKLISDIDESWLVTELSNWNTTGTKGNQTQLSTNFRFCKNLACQQTNATTSYGIWFDADGDGDIDKADDWPIYNDIFIVERTLPDITITPALRIGNASYLENDVVEIKGQEYWVKDYDSDNTEITLVPVSKETLLSADQTQDMLDAALLIPGTDIKIGMQNLTRSAGVNSTKFAIIEGGVVTSFKFRDNATTDPLFIVGEDQELISDFFIVPVNVDVGNEIVELAIGKKTDEFEISDNDKNVLGYASVEIKERTDSGDGIGAEWRLEDDDIVVVKDSEAQLGATDTYFQYTDDREIDLVRKKAKSAASGTALDASKTPWSDFLDKDVRVTITGGTTGAISLSTVKDTDVTNADKSGYNLVLVGGPVANALTADLVTGDKSTVDWHTSPGQTEVVSSAFATNRYAIIVAGEDRDATRAAADALAAQI